MGNACGALVVSRHGCAPAMPTWVELQSVLRAGGEPQAESFTRELDHVHWASTRGHDYPELMVLAIDHRSQFEDPENFGSADKERIATFKILGLRALHAAARQERRFGVLLDGRYGVEALSEAADLPYWIGRPIEIPQSRPLEFEGCADVAVELLSWPLTQVVKCLVSYHPDDAAELKGRQERQLQRLFDACRKTRHELLIEVILPREMPVDSQTMSRALSRIYALDVRPDWWKLPAGGSAAHWQAIQDTIRQEDPLCRGVLLLGLAQPETELVACFGNVAPFGIVKGFAIGRTIFQDVARAWFADSMSDADAVKAMAAKFSRLANAWQSARTAVAV